MRSSLFIKTDSSLTRAGSTHTMTPREFVDDLKVLEIGGVGSRAMPNGLSEGRGQRPFQEFYDEVYFTRDAPPPQAAAPPPQSRTQPGRAAHPSPIPSYASGNSASTNLSGSAEKEKKKKRFFHF